MVRVLPPPAYRRGLGLRSPLCRANLHQLQRSLVPAVRPRNVHRRTTPQGRRDRVLRGARRSSSLPRSPSALSRPPRRMCDKLQRSWMQCATGWSVLIFSTNSTLLILQQTLLTLLVHLTQSMRQRRRSTLNNVSLVTPKGNTGFLYRKGIRDSERERLSRLCCLLSVEWVGPSSSSAPTLLFLYYCKFYSHYSCTLLGLCSDGGSQP